MKRLILLLSAAILTTSTSLTLAQEDHAYTEGPVLVVNFVRTQPGMFDEYMRYLDKTYADLVFTITYKDMAAFDTLQARMDPLAKKAFGSLPKAAAAAVDREKLRKEVGSQLVRQLILK
jgi:hypothetical protein